MSELLLSLEEFAERRGVEYDPTDVKALRALEDASGIIRRRAGQHITQVTGDTQELFGNWTERLWLPQRPVEAVTSIEFRDRYETVWTALVAEADYTWTRDGLVLRSCDWGGPSARARVVYDHGLEDVPSELMGVVSSVAARRMRDPSGNLQSETILGYAYQTSSDSSGAPVGITTEEAAIIDAFKPTVRE